MVLKKKEDTKQVHFRWYIQKQLLNHSQSNLAKSKFRPNSEISFCEIYFEKQIAPCVSTGGEVSFDAGHIIGFRPQTQKLKLHTKQIAPCESTAEEVSFEW